MNPDLSIAAIRVWFTKTMSNGPESIASYEANLRTLRTKLNQMRLALWDMTVEMKDGPALVRKDVRELRAEQAAGKELEKAMMKRIEELKAARRAT